VRDPLRRRQSGTAAARPRRTRVDRQRAYVSWGSTTRLRDAGHDSRLYASPPCASRRPSSTPTTPTRAPCEATAISRHVPIEAQMDDLAERLERTKWRIRRRNATACRRREPAGQRHHSCGMTSAWTPSSARCATGGPPPPAGSAAWLCGHVPRGGGARVYRSDGCGAILQAGRFREGSLITGPARSDRDRRRCWP